VGVVKGTIGNAVEVRFDVFLFLRRKRGDLFFEREDGRKRRKEEGWVHDEGAPI